MAAFSLFTDFFSSTFQYREYLKQTILRDLKTRYKRSTLGYLWSMLSPLFMMIILSVVFSSVMRVDIENYAVFLFIGMLTWAYFEGTCLGCLGVIRGNAGIINKVPVPKYIFIVAVAVYSLVDFFFALVPLLLVMLFTSHAITPAVLALPLILLPLFFLSVGVACVLSVMNVFFEDTQHLAGVAFRALYFLCPILYSREMLPEWLIKWIIINPMFTIIEQMRSLFYHGRMFDLSIYSMIFFASLLILAFGLWVFRCVDKKILYFL